MGAVTALAGFQSLGLWQVEVLTSSCELRSIFLLASKDMDLIEGLSILNTAWLSRTLIVAHTRQESLT